MSSSTKTDINQTRGEIERMVAAIQSAAARYEREREKLFTSSGRPLYSNDEHTKRLVALQEEAKKEALNTAERIRAAQEKIKMLETHAVAEATSLTQLSTAELERAAALRSFVEADVSTLDTRNLVANVQAAVAGGDKVAALLYARFLPARFEEAAAGRRDRWSSELDDLQRQLAGPTAEQLAEVESLRQASIDAQIAATKFRQQADGSGVKAADAFTQAIRAW